MNAIQWFEMDLAKQGIRGRMDAVQGDSGVRSLGAELCVNGIPWEIPQDADVLVCYRKPDGTGGTYDTLPDGTKAWSVTGNRLTVVLAPQVCTVPGRVEMELTLLQGWKQVTTFRTEVNVSGKVAEGGHSENYINLAAWLEKNGKRGASAYEVGVANGFDGTQKDWLASLRGRNGVTPSIGANGNWFIGTEDTGRPSCGRTPVRGLDYWTEEDVAELNGYVSRARSEADRAAAEAEGIRQSSGRIQENREDIGRLYSAMIVYTRSGPVVQEKWISGTPLEYKVYAAASQAGEGDPSPENVRPLAGVSMLRVTIGGADAQTNPDNRRVHAVQLPEVCYGGYIDWKRKKYVQTHRCRILDGSENYIFDGGSHACYFAANDMKKSLDYSKMIFCDQLKTLPYNQGADSESFYLTGYRDGADSYKTQNWIYMKLAAGAVDNSGVKSYVAGQFAAGTPVSVVYELAVPVERDLQSLPDLTAWDGLTTVYSDAKQVELTGYVNIQSYIDSKIDCLIKAPVIQ